MTVVGELGWSDKSGKRMGFIHYSHDYVWSSLTQQERRTVKYVRDMVTGLTFKPRLVEFQRGRIGLQKKRDPGHLFFVGTIQHSNSMRSRLQRRNFRKYFFNSIKNSVC